jgi:hypothetical protein
VNYRLDGLATALMSEHEVVVCAVPSSSAHKAGREAALLVADLGDDVRLVYRTHDPDEIAQMSRGMFTVTSEAIGGG